VITRRNEQREREIEKRRNGFEVTSVLLLISSLTYEKIGKASIMSGKIFPKEESEDVGINV